MKKFPLIIIMISSMLVQGFAKTESAFKRLDPITRSSGKFWNSYMIPTCIDLGAYGVAMAVKDAKNGIYVTRFDSTGNLAWNMIYPFGGKHKLDCVFGNSFDGKDIYTLTFDNMNMDGGGKNVYLRHIDASNGQSTIKKFEYEKFGHVLSLFANSKYLFVLTTRFALNDADLSTSSDITMYRYSKETATLEIIGHDLNEDAHEEKVYWQFVRVTDYYSEAYLVKDNTENRVEILLAKFDNNGKKISSNIIELQLKDHYTRQSNSLMPLGNGINRYEFQQNFIYIEPLSTSTATTLRMRAIPAMATCYLTYSDAINGYLIYGLLGANMAAGVEDEQCDGFYLAKIDTAYKVLSVLEVGSEEQLKTDPLFAKTKNMDRYISLFADPAAKRCVLYIYAIDGSRHILSIDLATLSILDRSKLTEQWFNMEGNKFRMGADFLMSNPEVTTELSKKRQITRYISTTNRQYAILEPIPGKSLNVLSTAIK